jgi:hypothetical protein
MNMSKKPGRSRRGDPSTSHEAAARIDATALENRVYHVLKLYGPPRGQPLCVVEIHRHLPELSIDTISPRMCEMVRRGLIVCLGKQPRGNRHGNVVNQFVYSITLPQGELFDNLTTTAVAQSARP